MRRRTLGAAALLAAGLALSGRTWAGPPAARRGVARLDGIARDPTAFDAIQASSNVMLAPWRGWSEAELRAIGAPMLVGVGDDDYVRIEHAAEFARRVPNAQLAVLPGTTHLQVVDRVAWVAPMFEAVTGPAG